MRTKILLGMALCFAPLPAFAAGNQSGEQQQGGGKVVYLPALPSVQGVRPQVSQAYQQKFPLSSAEIHWIRSQMQSSQYAMHNAPALTPDNRTITVSLGPGGKSPVIHLMPGYVTAISVVGSNGNPWPVGLQQMGSQKQFSIDSPETAQGKSSGTNKGSASSAPKNLILVQPKYFGSTSNQIVTLKNEDTPVMLMFQSGSPKSKRVDGRVTLRIDRPSPDSPPSVVIQPPPSPVNATLMMFLDQTPPKGATPLSVNGISGVKAWSWKNGVVVRTRLSLISPAWTAQQLQDGVSAYMLPQTSVLLVNGQDGNTHRVTLGDSSNG